MTSGTEKDWNDYRWQLKNRIGRVDVLSQILNLTDEEYATYVSYTESASYTGIKLYPGIPLTGFIGVSYKWGGAK